MVDHGRHHDHASYHGDRTVEAITKFAYTMLPAGAYTRPLSAQSEDLRDTSLTSELNLSTFGTHPRVDLGYPGVKVGLNERKGAT